MQVIVLGMHRSGTSVVTRLLNLMGCSLGPSDALMAPAPDNPKGFWENRRIVDINNQLLQSQGCDWMHLSNFDPAQCAMLATDKEKRTALHEIMKMDMARPWALKDPRLCLTLPYWKEMLECPLAIVVHRSPLEIAHSLRTRNGIPTAVGLALWERYSISALQGLSGLPVLFAPYADFLSDPVSATNRLHGALLEHGVRNLSLPTEAEILAFITPQLYRQRTSSEEIVATLTGAQHMLSDALARAETSLVETPPKMSAGSMEVLEYFDRMGLPTDKDKLESDLAQEKAYRERLEVTRTDLEARHREVLRGKVRGLVMETNSRVRDLRFVLDAGRLHEATNRALLESSRWKVGDRLVSLAEKALGKPRQSQSPVHMAAAHAQLEAARGQLEELGIRKRLAEMDKRLSRASDDQAFQSIQRDLSGMQQDVARLLRQSVEAFERAHEFSQMVQRSTRWRLGALVMGLAAKGAPRPVPTVIPASLEALAHAFRAWKGAGGVPGMAPLPKLAGTAAAQGPVPIPKEAIDSIRITQFTPPSPRNPFFTLVPHELARRGWHVDYMVERDALLARVRKGAFKHEVVLFHHLDPLYHDRGGDAAATARNADALIAFFEQLAAAGAHIVYNAHNPVPHASPDVETDLKVQDAMHRLAARVIVLGESARDDLAEHVAAGKVAVLPHPTFAGHYGPPVERSEARAKLGLPADAVILGSIGELKPYKGLSLLIEGYRRFRAAHPDSPAHLVIAGREGKQGFADEVRAQLPPDATLHAGEIPDSELPVWLGALDLSVFGFERMWVSSTVLLSLSYGVPVIAPDVGCFHEYAPDADRGFLYEPGDADALAAAIERAVNSPLLPHMRYLCGVFNKKYAVPIVADRYERFYASLAGYTGEVPHV